MKVVAYYRVSTAQQKRSGLGLEAQRMAVSRFISERRAELVEGFTEIESGRMNARPKLRDALRTCRVYGATLVIARLDRLARNVGLIANLMEANVDFLAADMPFANKFTIHLLAAVAEYEAKLIGDRVRNALAVLKARGVKLGPGKRPPGWGKDLGRQSWKGAQAFKRDLLRYARKLAPLVCRLRDEGKSLNGIARAMNDLGVPTFHPGHRWHGVTVEAVFKRLRRRPPEIRPTRPDRKRRMLTSPRSAKVPARN